MDNPLCSLIICTHNPRLDYLTRVIDAISKQSLEKRLYELIIIDNCSKQAVSKNIDISWHPNNKIVTEEKLGLTQARLRGFKESVADIIIFCDDDNVLEHKYLENSLKIAKAYPFLGAWGGSCIGEFECQLPEWWKDSFFRSIGVRKVDQIKWSNILNDTCPIGAGMILRRNVANAYVNKIQASNILSMMDRCGKNLMSGGDIDLANTACELGMGTGLFPELRLTHLISKQRLTIDYYEKLTEGIATSLTILKFIQGKQLQSGTSSTRLSMIKIFFKDLYSRLRLPKEQIRINRAWRRGIKKGSQMFASSSFAQLS